MLENTKTIPKVNKVKEEILNEILTYITEPYSILR